MLNDSSRNKNDPRTGVLKRSLLKIEHSTHSFSDGKNRKVENDSFKLLDFLLGNNTVIYRHELRVSRWE